MLERNYEVSVLSKPVRNKPLISFAIPSSIVLEAPGLREKTRKVGYVGRAAAIFRVEEILVYKDFNSRNLELVETILSYLETPPYLRRRLIPRKKLLRYAGILPPLKTPHHLYPNIFDTSFREGVVVTTFSNGSLVDIGLDKYGFIPGAKIKVGTRITVKILDAEDERYIVKQVNRDIIDIYWGYIVKRYNSMREMFEKATRRYDTIIGATKKGEIIFDIEEQLAEDLAKSNKALIIFGGPKHDIDEIASNEGFSIKEYSDYLVNFVPRQGVENIRTEEALFIVLGLVNYLKERVQAKVRKVKKPIP